MVLEKAIATAAKFQLFEFNDEFTRASFRNLVEPFLRDVQGRRGIFDFKVVCDDTNNTPEVIDRNEFIGDIYIKPARSINFITLNFVAVRTGVEFEEVVATGLDVRRASFLCKASTLPAFVIPEIAIPFRGRNIYVAGDRTFDDPWTTTFLNDTDFALRTSLELWSNGINDLEISAL